MRLTHFVKEQTADVRDGRSSHERYGGVRQGQSAPGLHGGESKDACHVSTFFFHVVS
jgi:hypothetical protein